MRIDIMTDIETLGTSSDSTIIQISAIAFDITTGKYLSEFNQIADVEKNKQMVTDGSTIKWWLNTNKELLQELINKGEHSSEQILSNFYYWIVGLSLNEQDKYLWGNGILFDNKIIQHQLNEIGFPYPIYYKNDRDVRTIVDLASVKLGVSEKQLKESLVDDSLTNHNALDDVKYQIELVKYCYKMLTFN